MRRANIAKRRRSDKPIIPQKRRIKRKLEELEDVFIKLFDYRKKFFSRHRRVHDYKSLIEQYGQRAWEDVEQYYATLEQCRDLVIRLVHLDNTQLYHPFVQIFLQWATSKDFFKRLHRGLEVGVKRGIESLKGIAGKDPETNHANAVMVLNVLRKDRKLFTWDKDRSKAKSYTVIQMFLETKGWIKPMSRQAFHKMARKLLFMNESLPGLRYNIKAFPPTPKKVLPEWETARILLQEYTEILGQADQPK